MEDSSSDPTYLTPQSRAVVRRFCAGNDTVAVQAPEQAPENVDPPLSDEQQSVLERVLRGENIFYTGSAGVGKSLVTRAIIKRLQHKYPGLCQIAVTSTTGIAATNIEGCTLHSWAGLGLAKLDADRLFWSLKGGSKADARNRWLQVKALIIDEGAYPVLLIARLAQC